MMMMMVMVMMVVDTGELGETQHQSDTAYKAGFSACASEALRHIHELDDVSVSTRHRLADALSAHLQQQQPSTAAAMLDDDVTVASMMTSWTPTCDVTMAVPRRRRRLFDCTSAECREGPTSTSQRRPLADIQPSATCRRLPAAHCHSSRVTSAVSSCTADRSLPFPSCSGHVMTCEEFPVSSDVVSRRVTVTETMMTSSQQQKTTHEPTPSGHTPQHDSRCSSAGSKLEPMWRPW